MDEIASHIIDIVANSVTAKATYIIVEITSNTNKDLLSLYIKDDGLGMDEETVKKVLDPFYSTKIGKKVGLGSSTPERNRRDYRGYFPSLKCHRQGDRDIRIF